MNIKTISLLLTTTLSLGASEIGINQQNAQEYALSHNQQPCDHISAQLNSIYQAKQEILAELRNTLIVSKKAKYALKLYLNYESYAALKSKMYEIVTSIACSQEFIDAINHTIEYQLSCICEKQQSFDDIAYKTNEALIRKIDDELSRAFPELDEKTNEIFNIFYITYANSRGCKLLLNKLEKQEKKLQKQSCMLTIMANR